MRPPEPRVALLGARPGLVSEALSGVLADAGNRVLGACSTCEQLDALAVDGGAPQVVLVDFDGSGVDGHTLARMRHTDPAIRIVVLCAEVSPAVVRCALNDGVDGVVLKSDGVEQLCDAVGHALAGRAVMPTDWDAAVRGAPIPLPALSARERQVLELAGEGLSNAEIASRMMISKSTVKFHLRSAYARLGARNRVEAVRALRRG
jgi:two-component system response regulator DesR